MVEVTETLADPSKTRGILKWALSDVTSIKNIPIWAFHGDKDKICPIARDQKVFAKMQQIGGNMKFTIWSGDGHGVAEKMIIGGDNGSTQFSSDRCAKEPVFMKWLFAQSLLERN